MEIKLEDVLVCTTRDQVWLELTLPSGEPVKIVAADYKEAINFGEAILFDGWLIRDDIDQGVIPEPAKTEVS